MCSNFIPIVLVLTDGVLGSLVNRASVLMKESFALTPDEKTGAVSEEQSLTKHRVY